MTTLQNEPTNKRFRFSRYRFDSQIRKDIQKLTRVDNWHGPLQVAVDWLWILGAITVSWTCWQIQPWPISVGIYAVALAIIGARQRGLKVNNHQATHHALAHNPWLNYLLGTLFSGWPVLESYSGYDDTHNSLERGHHPNLGTERDPDYQDLVAQDLYGADRTPDNARRYLWSIPFKPFSYLRFLVRNRIWNPKEQFRERLARLLFLGGVVITLIGVGLGPVLLLYWVVPLLTTALWIGSFIELSEHYPLLEMEHTTDLFVSRNRILGPVAAFFFSAHQEGYHLVHHLLPTMPFWNAKKAHTILLRDPTYASLHPKKGGLATLLMQILNQT